MIKILLIRHGQSLSNDSGTITGQIDSPLSELGLKQADIVSRYLYKNYKIDAIYSSDLSRAVNTIEPLSKKIGQKIIKTPNLREMYCGDWEGERVSVLNKNPLYVKWRDNDLTIKMPNGESFLDVQKRAIKCINEIVAKNDGKTVVVVTHGGVVRMILASILNISHDNWKEKLGYVTNASTTLIEYNNGIFKVCGTSDDYLGELISAMPKGI